MTIGSINLKLRPIRIGFLVKPNDKDGIRKAIHLNSMLWGGMFNPLIPCYTKLPRNWEEYKSKRTTATKVISGYIEGFDPDYLVNVSDVSVESIDFDLERIISYESIISGYKEDMAPKLGAGIFEIIGQFKYDEMRFIRRNEFKFLKPKLSTNHNLFLASIFGELDNFEKVLYENYLSGIEITESDIDIKNYWKYFTREYFYSRRIGAIYLEQGLRGPVIFYLDATKTLDVIDYWNMRASGWDVYPVAKQSEDENGLHKICEKIIERAYRPYRHNKDIYHFASIIKSRNTTEKEMSDFNKKLKVKKHDTKKGPKVSLQRWYPRIWDEWARQNTQEVITPAYSKEKEIELQEGQTEFRFKTLNPDFDLFHVNTSSPRFALEVDSRVYGNDELLAEVIPLGGEILSRAVGKYSLREWRISRSGPVYLSHYENWTVSYEIPLAEPVMTAWFKEKGWEVDISPSGKVAKQMIKQLGGLWGVVHLKEEKLIKLLQELSNNGFINEYDFKGRISQITNSDEVWISRDEYIKRLLEKEIFQLGVELKCPICTQRSWYSLNDMNSEVRCNGCLSDYKVQSLDLSDKKWAYKSFGTFGLPKQAYGAFGVLLALQFLVKDNHERATALLSFVAKKNNKEIEADLCLVTEKEFRDNSTQDLLFCECKTYNKFEKKDVDRMRVLAKEFPGAVLVFSTLRMDLTTTEKRMLKPLVNSGRRYWKAEKTYNPVIVLTGNELFSSHGIPYCWKDKEGKAGEIAESNFYPRGLSDIADVTQQIYLDMKPYHEWREEQWKKRQKVS
ncbi:MAG: hypothetical protein HND53_00045 [Proteobacteria bacterium]|nr:hypothetical protein [Pseudomonadota bacterium]NOG58865.1 hypothetical protein [Pseudomonadota bacterium]